MSNLTTTQKLLILLAAWLLLSGGVGGSPAPFKADKLSVLMIEDSSAAGRAKLTSNQENILRGQEDGSVRKFVADHGGELQVLDPANKVDADSPWVALAMAAVNGKQPPWIVAASPRGGFSLPIGPADTSQAFAAKLSPLAK